jgi:hypothetical protein
VIALVASAGGYLLGSARADSLSEPDAYAVLQQVQVLQDRVDTLESDNAASERRLDVAISDIVVLDNRTNDESALGCLAYSDRHYYKEQMDGKGPRVRLPVMVWNTTLRSCRPSAKAWRPHGRALVPVVASR